jgi:hypothetical protein
LLDAAYYPVLVARRAGFGDLNGDGLMDLVTADAVPTARTKPFA